MLELVTGGPSWATRNVQLLTLFAPLLLLTGVLGFVVPAQLSLMSGAPPYNVFHLLAGATGLVLVLTRQVSGVIAFNLIFGLIDLYQAAAGVTGLFPAHFFALRPADHVVHIVVGVVLVGVGYQGKREQS
jgi:hypothetical protein